MLEPGEMTLQEVSDLTGLSKSTLLNHIRTGGLRARKEPTKTGQWMNVVTEEDLYDCDVPVIRDSLDPAKRKRHKDLSQINKELSETLADRDGRIADLEDAIEKKDRTIAAQPSVEQFEEMKDECERAKTFCSLLATTLWKDIRWNSYRKIRELLEDSGIEIAGPEVGAPFRSGDGPFLYKVWFFLQSEKAGLSAKVHHEDTMEPDGPPGVMKYIEQMEKKKKRAS
ncbi:MAG: helix-turn-helix domain-containing protein [Actinobacteria bacterium]|nr:helix-turn-helix domain-containing protein [Actinomycetota bacterium]